MMNHIDHFPKSTQGQERGMALVASLIILLLMTILGLSIMKSNNSYEKNSGNTRDKQRALQAAQDALLYGEWWLNNNSVNNTTCSKTAVPTKLQICNYDPLQSTANIAANVQWFSYTPTGIKPQSSGNTTNGGLVTPGSSTSDILYAKSPGLYINCISPCTSLPTGQLLYRVTAIGYGGVGGANGTVAIVQSIYAAGSPVNVSQSLTD